MGGGPQGMLATTAAATAAVEPEWVGVVPPVAAVMIMLCCGGALRPSCGPSPPDNGMLAVAAVVYETCADLLSSSNVMHFGKGIKTFQHTFRN